MKVILLVIGLAFCVSAQTALVVPPEKSKPVRIPKFDKPPVIDGKLDEEVWQKAVVLKDFYQIQPGDNTPPSKPTEVLLGFDPKFLYIAFKATDEPDKIRATIAKRDNIWQDDYVGVMLDTFNDKRKAFEVFFNPHGIQGDGILTEGRGEDMSVDLLMDSKGIVHETGYDVEIAIPFKSLRFEAGKGKLWGVHFFRRIKRFENEMDSWMPFSRSIDSRIAAGTESAARSGSRQLAPVQCKHYLSTNQRAAHAVQHQQPTFATLRHRSHRVQDPHHDAARHLPVHQSYFCAAHSRLQHPQLTLAIAGVVWVDAEPRNSVLRRLQRRSELRHASPVHTKCRARFPPQWTDSLHQDVVPDPEGLLGQRNVLTQRRKGRKKYFRSAAALCLLDAFA